MIEEGDTSSVHTQASANDSLSSKDDGVSIEPATSSSSSLSSDARRSKLGAKSISFDDDSVIDLEEEEIIADIRGVVRSVRHSSLKSSSVQDAGQYRRKVLAGLRPS